jgi:hypothetical protein
MSVNFIGRAVKGMKNAPERQPHRALNDLPDEFCLLIGTLERLKLDYWRYFGFPLDSRLFLTILSHPATT